MNPARPINLIVLHCSATPAHHDIGVKEIDRWHRQRGFTSIGYHFVIRRSGGIEKGREVGTIGAHAKGFNRDSIGICLVGGVNANDLALAEDNFTPEQWAYLRALLRTLTAPGMYPKAGIVGHRDLPGVHKACPAFDVATWLKENPLW